MDYCGCSKHGSSTTPCPQEVYSTNDRLCWVNPQRDTDGWRGGFTLRQASTFGDIGTKGGIHNGIYDTSGTTQAAELYNYVALPSTNIDLWMQTNTTVDRRNRFFMVLRMYYWILLTIDTSQQGMSELGFSTFLNNAGYDEDKNVPFIPLNSSPATLSTRLAFYSTQPLLVYEKGAQSGEYDQPAFYTMQELMEGVYSQDADTYATSASAAPIPDAANLISQLSMWTYDSNKSGLGGNVARDGMTTATVDSASPSQQVEEGQRLRGLLQGTFGYCNMWYTTNSFVGGTLGTASAMVALAIGYVLLHHFVLHNRNKTRLFDKKP